MSLRSQYLSGDDEEEIFRLTDPDVHPESGDESVARQEEESLAGSSYDDDQEEFDNSVEPSDLATALPDLTYEELAEVASLVEEIQRRREKDVET